MDVSSLPKTVTRQRRGCDLNPGPAAPESSTLTTRLPSQPLLAYRLRFFTRAGNIGTWTDEVPNPYWAWSVSREQL